MFTSIQYKEKGGQTRHGRASFMRPDGTLDSTGHFVNGLQHGIWLYFNGNGILTTKKEYSLGVLSSTWNAQDKKDSTNPDKEAEFPDAVVGWQKHLIKNLRYPIYAQEHELQGTVIVYFQVDTEGNLHDMILLKSASLPLDDEAIRMLRISPKWIPATKNGQVVKSYKQQPVMFRLEKG